MKKDNIASSNIKSIEWNDNKLTIYFTNGSIYDYLNVPKSVWDQVEHNMVKSYGKWLKAVIIPAYKSVKVR